MSICKVCLDDIGRASMLSAVTTNFWGFTSFWVLTATLKCCFDCLNSRQKVLIDDQQHTYYHTHAQMG